MGKDLIYLVSGSGNYLGAKWLQSVLGDEYRVHTTEGIYRSAHRFHPYCFKARPRSYQWRRVMKKLSQTF